MSIAITQKSRHTNRVVITQEVLDHLDPLRRLVAEELIRKGEWQLLKSEEVD